MVRDDHSARHGDTDAGGQGVVEELIVSAPPKGVIDYDGPGEHGVLEIGPIEGDVVRDAVDDDAIARWLGHADGAEFDVFGAYVLNGEAVDAVDESGREGFLHPV